MEKLERIKFYNSKSKKDLGEFIPTNKENSTIQREVDSIISNINSTNNGEKTIAIGNSHFSISWKTTKSLLAIIIVTKVYIDKNTINILIEEIDNQNIVKYLDNKGYINNVAKQNLQYIVEKYFENNSNNSTKNNSLNNSSLLVSENNSNTSKISSIKDEIGDVTNTMRNNIKNMVSNVESSKELDERSVKIKDNSMLFKNQAESLKRVAKCRRYRNFIIIAGLIGLLIITVLLILN